jgi:L-fucose mutarotase
MTPDLLKVLAEMGHGDEIVIADANFTSASLGRCEPIIPLPGAGVQRTCEAVLSVFPLDAMVERPLAYMRVGGTPDGCRSALQRRAINAFEAAGWLSSGQCEATERFAFYERVRDAFAIVHTGGLQPWANFIPKKGVLGDALEP